MQYMKFLKVHQQLKSFPWDFLTHWCWESMTVNWHLSNYALLKCSQKTNSVLFWIILKIFPLSCCLLAITTLCIGNEHIPIFASLMSSILLACGGVWVEKKWPKWIRFNPSRNKLNLFFQLVNTLTMLFSLPIWQHVNWLITLLTISYQPCPVA